ncbi:cytochrome c oxidase subunit 2A [Peribacillus butanolivorans]
MAAPKLKNKSQIKETSNLKGTLASVLILGIILIIAWVSIYFIFVNRLG